MRAMRERLKAVETLKKAAEKLGKGASRGRAGKRKNRNYAHSKTAVQNFFYAAACASHCPNKSLCVPVRANVSINKSSSMR